MLAFALFSVTLLLLILPRVRSEPFFSPVSMFLYGGALVEGAYASGLVAYDNQLSIFTVAVLVASKVFFLGGAFFVGRSPRGKAVVGAGLLKFDQIDRIVLLIFSLGAVGAGILAISEAIRLGALNSGFFSGGGLANARRELWDGLNSGAAAVSPIRAFLSAVTFSLAVLLPYFWAQRRTLLMFVSAYSCLVIVAESMTAGGRFSIALLVFSLSVSSAAAFLKTRLADVINIRAAILVGITAFYVLIVFPVQRNPELPYAVDTYLGWIAEAEIASWVHEVSSFSGFEWFTVFAYSTSYFSGALDKLNYFVVSTDVGDWYMFGLYNLPIISQLGSALGFSEYYWLEIRSLIADEMAHVGLAGNPWSTGIRDFSIDFGFAGAVFASALFGASCQYSYIRAYTSRRIYWKILSLIAVVASFIMAFVSPFQIRLLANTLILCLLILSFRRLASVSFPVKRLPRQ